MPLLTPSSPAVAWMLIAVSGLLEIGFAMSMNYSSGFTRLLPSMLTLFFGGLSVYLMSLSLAVIPIGTAYAVWGAIGAVDTVRYLGMEVDGAWAMVAQTEIRLNSSFTPRPSVQTG